jgi:hypothetical protein
MPPRHQVPRLAGRHARLDAHHHGPCFLAALGLHLHREVRDVGRLAHAGHARTLRTTSSLRLEDSA